MSGSKDRDLCQCPDAYPEKILSIVEINKQPYALVEWHSFGEAYCPYDFMKDHFPRLLFEFYTSKLAFKKYRNHKDLDDLECRRSAAEEELRTARVRIKKTKKKKIVRLESDEGEDD